jgi:endoglucanase
MQDDDGGVWHKQTSERFCGFVMPEKDQFVSYVIGTGAAPFKSSCATADFAAVMAIAGRVYRPFNPAFAAKSLAAAEKAWSWLDKFPNVTFRNPPGVATGGYGDSDCGDEHLWAAAELARTTSRESYRKYFLEHYSDYRKAIRDAQPQSWANVANLALWTYAFSAEGDPAAVAAIRQDSLAAADRIVERSGANGYRISMTSRDYIWGSNSVVANYGMQLLVANALHAKPAYVETALENLHYLLGRNTFSLSFVTQVGTNPFRHPHHRPSGADENPEPWPGLLSGGPNRSRQDPAMRKLPADLPPAKMFLDDQEAYAANEVAINWNAPLVFLLAGALASK